VRHGRVRHRRRSRVRAHPGCPHTPITGPNVVWSVDFKGQFRLGNGHYCYPLTVQDAYSRYLLACDGLEGPLLQPTQQVFQRLFRTYGLPERIRSDNGQPFASCALGRLSQLSVWWLRLGVRPELIEPASPHQNGRHERMHRDLKAETTRPAAPSLSAQQRRFDAFRPSGIPSTNSGPTKRSASDGQRRSMRPPIGSTSRGSGRLRTPSTSRCDACPPMAAFAGTSAG
jgi:putative transposase